MRIAIVIVTAAMTGCTLGRATTVPMPSLWAGCWEVGLASGAEVARHPGGRGEQPIGLPRHLVLETAVFGRFDVDTDGRVEIGYRVGARAGTAESPPSTWFWIPDKNGFEVYWSPPHDPRLQYSYSFRGQGDTLTGGLLSPGAHISIVLDSAAVAHREPCSPGDPGGDDTERNAVRPHAPRG